MIELNGRAFRGAHSGGRQTSSIVFFKPLLVSTYGEVNREMLTEPYKWLFGIPFQEAASYNLLIRYHISHVSSALICIVSSP